MLLGKAYGTLMKIATLGKAFGRLAQREIKEDMKLEMG